MDPEDERRTLCQPIVRRLINRYDWRLLPEDEFITAVLDRAPEQSLTDPGALRRWCINTYCVRALYPACNGEQGGARRRRGFEEVADYLHRLAARGWPGVAEDAAQDAIERVYDKISDCRHPGAFLEFAIQKLRDAAKKYIKAETRAVSLDELLEQGLYGGMAADEKTPEEAARDADRKREIAERIQAIEKRYPKAGRQFQAFRLRHCHGLSNEEIGQVMGETPANVSVLISRARKKLQEDPRLWELTEEISRE